MKLSPKYGWKPDSPDGRDHLYSLIKPSLPHDPSIDITIRYKQPAIYDQGQIGSCTANAIAFALQFDLLNNHSQHSLTNMMPSRLFIYYNERLLENTVLQDSGAQIRDGIKSVASQGACNENEWPYGTFRLTTKPTTKCYTDASQFKAVSYQRLDNTNINQLLDVLHSGFPFVFGFTCYESFEGQEVATTGLLNLPAPTEQPIGGHAVACVGYNAQTKRFIVRNSWGSLWGKRGYFTIPQEYLMNLNLADDFWVIKTTL